MTATDGEAAAALLHGQGLPARWQGRTRFVILQTGFGLGRDFLATWAAWRADARRGARLEFVAIEPRPPTRADLMRAHAGSTEPRLASQLVAQWPPLTPDLHTLTFEGGAVRLRLALGDVATWLPELVLAADAFYLDSAAPEHHPPLAPPEIWQRLGRLAAPGATAVTRGAAQGVHEGLAALGLRDGLAAAGFIVDEVPGPSGQQEMTVARFAPRHLPAVPPGRRPAMLPLEEPVLVIGAGLAGAAAAQALAREGLAVTVLEREGAPARATSGNPGGLFHGVLHRDDGAHARWHRAAALQATRAWAAAVAAGVPGAVQGLLRLEPRQSLADMQAHLADQGLPPDYVQALDAAAARALAGIDLPCPAWFYPGAGWIAPAQAVPWWLATPGIMLHVNRPVARLQRAGPRWQALDADGHVLAEATQVVLANAADARRLAGPAWREAWPSGLTRGQVTVLPAGAAPMPRLPVAGGGYALTLPDGRVLCGATQQRDDDDPAVREADHAHNLAQLARITGVDGPAHPADPALKGRGLEGRTGWRWHTDDRLPLIGPLPAIGLERPPRWDQPRTVAREPGLWLLGALGSRGLTHAPLAGDLLAAWMTGAPWPVAAALADRVDAARLFARPPRSSAKGETQ